MSEPMTASTSHSAEPTVEEALRPRPEWMEEIVRRHDYDSSTLSAEATEIAQNIIANGGITKDRAAHALEIVNAHVLTLARGALGLSVDRDRLLLAISEVHSGNAAEAEKIVEAVMGEESGS